MVTFGVSIPLPVSRAERQDRESAAKLAFVEKAEANLAEATRSATAEYRSLASDALRLAERVQRYQSSIVVPAQQRTVAALAGYRSNQVSLMTLFESRHAEVEAQRKLLVLRRELAKAQAQLAFKPLVEWRRPMKRAQVLVWCRSRCRGAGRRQLLRRQAHWPDRAGRDERRRAGLAPRRPAIAKCSIGTTRWCRGRASTSRASRRSWTCSSCPSMPTRRATPASR